MRFVSCFCDGMFLLRFLRSDYGLLFLPSLLKMLATSRLVTRSPGFDVCSFPRSRVGRRRLPVSFAAYLSFYGTFLPLLRISLAM